MKRQAGFTIIEMLIVVTILAMLAGILIPVLGDAAKSSRDSRRATDLKSVQSALEAYKRANGTYPSTAGEWQGDSTGDGGMGYNAAGYIPNLVPTFLPSLPKDPDSRYPNATQGYAYRSDGTDFKFVCKGTPESFPTGNIFFDPAAQAANWQVSSPGAYTW